MKVNNRARHGHLQRAPVQSMLLLLWQHDENKSYLTFGNWEHLQMFIELYGSVMQQLQLAGMRRVWPSMKNHRNR
eukprot:1160513-Pelagomonas_calceolata.AAC.26